MSRSYVYLTYQVVRARCGWLEYQVGWGRWGGGEAGRQKRKGKGKGEGGRRREEAEEGVLWSGMSGVVEEDLSVCIYISAVCVVPALDVDYEGYVGR